MASNDVKDYCLQLGCKITKVSGDQVTLSVMGVDGKRKPITISWSQESYPNPDLDRLFGDHRGMLKAKSKDAPQVGAAGELYVARSVCNTEGLDERKYPSELPAQSGFKPRNLRPMSLRLQALDENDDEFELELLLQEHADLSHAIVMLPDGRLRLTINSKMIQPTLRSGTPGGRRPKPRR
jgi:hypothetical protein